MVVAGAGERAESGMGVRQRVLEAMWNLSRDGVTSRGESEGIVAGAARFRWQCKDAMANAMAMAREME
jgi:hypothetical protein